MGVKATARQSKDGNDASDGVRDAANGEGPMSSNRLLEKQVTARKRVDNVLDDVMGDLEDFRDLADSDEESDGGRWEDAVRAALDREEAGNGATHQVVRESEGAYSKETRELSSGKDDEKHESPREGPSVGPTSSRDPGCSGQRAKGRDNKGSDRQSCELSPHVGHEPSVLKQGKVHHTRYFIIKSLNHHNIVKSIENGIWATQAMNEPVLNEAYETSKRVLLIFSVNMSGHFQGYAQMTSPIGRRRANVWTEGNEGANPWGGSFRVEWLRLHDLPFQKTVHLKNPLNSFKPVKISRDCQELTQEIGDELCGLIDDGADREGKPKRKVLLSDITGHTAKKQRSDMVGLPPDMPFGQAMLPGTNGGARFPSSHPPYFHSGNSPNSLPPTEALDLQPRSFQNGVRSDRLRVSRSKSPHPTASDQSTDWDRDHDRDSRRRRREAPVGSDRRRDTRSSSSGGSGDTAVEEDLLNMTYEEYLQRHGRAKDYSGHRQGAGPYPYHHSNPAYGRNWMAKNPRVGSSDDQYSNYIANWYSRQGPAQVGDEFLGSGVSKHYPEMGSCPNWNWKSDDGKARRLSRT
ncbi:hypothetical protein R1sor_002102 [Riccia sorocarpa]|uniref:YTH domain-containing protein n=1 Tax=Riccia sorocarpa TaxID=122646 RepID=A0ABD3H0Y0_9MARC